MTNTYADWTKGEPKDIRDEIDWKARAEAAEAERDSYRARKDGAYEERNRVVAALAAHYPSGITRTDIPGWDAEWHGCVYIDTPVGQLSWHYHDSQAHLFAHLPAYAGSWDGHDTPEKYRRLARIADLEAHLARVPDREAVARVLCAQQTGIGCLCDEAGNKPTCQMVLNDADAVLALFAAQGETAQSPDEDLDFDAFDRAIKETADTIAALQETKP